MRITANNPEATDNPQREKSRESTGWIRTVALTLVLIMAVEVALRAVEPMLPVPLKWPIANMQAKAHQMSSLDEARVDLAFVGSSIVFDSVDPLAFTVATGDEIAAYNAAVAGAISPRTWRWWVEKVVVPGLNPSSVVIGVSSVDVNSGAPDLFWPSLMRSRGYATIEQNSEASILARMDASLEDSFALFRLRTVLREPLRVLTDFGDDSSDDLQIGQMGKTIAPDPPYELTEEVVNRLRNQQLAQFTTEGDDIDELSQMARDLVEKGIEVVVVAMPVTPDLMDLHPGGAGEFDSYVEALRAMADAAGVRFIDLTDAIEGTQFFSDPTHLNDLGARLLAEQLAAQLGFAP